MDSLFDIALMTNNYSHDIATAILAISGAAMWMLSRNYPESATQEMELYFVRIYQSITKMAKYSLIWILIAGVPRVTFYKQYEWSTTAGDLQVIAIMIKHIVMFLLVGTGLFYWSKLSRRVKLLKIKNNTGG